MFSIENYLTGLIINKVEKFVKNINPNEFKVSLWGGDVTFQNLELKLDVLDEELQLPFTFISGHVQFLKLQIPWTKIATEPITATINDLELVLKLKDAATIPPSRKERKKKTSLEEDSSAGYLASLITKVINNISIICNNISIKFLEDDIVFSMNIQHLSVYSADGKWKRAFMDVTNASNVIFRKLINIIDFTMCLDKRNSLGKIEFVQEPFLYKCSIELRVFRKYNAVSPEKHSITRIDLQTKALNINISSQQFPMLVRLFDLIMALKSGKLQESYGIRPSQNATSENNDENEESWLSWMWNNIVPTIISDEQQNEDFESHNKNIFEFGTYFEDVCFSLKSQELLPDPIIPSAKKAILKSLIELNLKEAYATTIICGGRRHFNVRGGIDYIEVKALDDCCPCGTITTQEYILQSGKKESTGQYLLGSYFDKNYKSRNRYDDLFNNYFEKNNEETLLTKVSAMAFDIFHSVEIPDDRGSSDISSDLEYSNFSENYLIRVYGNGLSINASSDAIHRIEKIVQYYKDCEFTSYVKEEKIPLKNQLSPATADDYEALVNEIPARIISIKLKNTILHVKEWNHARTSLRSSRKYVRQNSLYEISSKSYVDLEMKIGEFLTTIEVPLYKNRLVYTTCQLADSINNKLFQKCFSIISTNVKNVMVDMKYNNNTKKVCEILKISSTVKTLIYPHLWEEFDIQENYYDIEFNGLSFMMNSAQFIMFYRITNSIVQQIPINENEPELLQSLNNSELVVIQLTSRILQAKVSKLQRAMIAEFTISDLIGLSWKTGIKSTVLNMPDTTHIPAFFSSKMKNFKSEAMLSLSIQIPLNNTTNDQQLLTTILIETSGGCINLDPMLREFLSFKLFQGDATAKELNRTLSTSTKPLLNEFSNVQESSLHSSSEYPDTICPSIQTAKVDKDILYYFKMCRNFVINVNMKPLEFYYSTTTFESLKASDSIRDIIQLNGINTIVLKTPSISFHSIKNKQLSKLITPSFPSTLPNFLWSNENCSTWNLELNNLNMFIIGSEKKRIDLIQNTSIKVSIADESQLNETAYTGNILIEIFPLYMNFYTSQIDLIYAAIKELSNFSLLNTHSKCNIQENVIEQENPSNALDIKEFLGLPTGSTITKTSIPDGSAIRKSKSNINFYIQWICSKVCLSMIADTLPTHKKFVMEIDETLFSLHQQEFFQLKCKITAISANLFHLTNSDKWIKNLNLGFNVQSEETISDNVSRFLDMTITRAETMNVHSKWNLELKKSSQLILTDVSEINVILQNFDLIASDEFIHFLPILKLFQRPNDKNQKSFIQYSGSELPLFHLKCNGFRVFLPNLHKTSDYNVLILKVSGLQISPNAVNNLIRTQIIRPDIHSKASHLGVLDVIGSKIEDRQYQLLIKGCSLNSSNWNEITAIISEKNVENYDNPATIWNNFENGPSSSPNFKFNTIFKDSSFSFIYAPCIKFKEVLVAGAAIEINCIEQMNIVTSLEQMILFIDIGNQMKNITEVLSRNNEGKDQTTNDTKSEEITNGYKIKRVFDKKSFDDSGVASTISHSNQMKSKKFLLHKKLSSQPSENSSLVPFEFTFTSSKFLLNVSIENKNYSVLLDTPNLYITTHNNGDKSFNISLYDLKIDYETLNIFSTRHGNIDSISGITPSLLRIKITEKACKNTDLSIELKRSIYLRITKDGIAELLRILNILKHNSTGNIITPQIMPIKSKIRKFDIMKSHMKSFKILNLLTDQIVVEFISDENNFKAGLQHLKGKLKLFDRPEKIEMNMDLSHITLQCEEKMFLHPLNIEAKAKVVQEYWKKEPLIYVNVGIDYVKLDIWPNSIKQFQNFGKMIKSLVNDSSESDYIQEESKCDEIHEKIEIITDAMKVKASDEIIEHFLDDLRSGIYTFVEIETPFQELPLPYQIHYQEVGIICWRYPLPRALHKIKIFPVPFQTVNEIKFNCTIEYFNILKSQFEEFISLSLNENETKMLDLKPNVPFSEVWRIKFQVNLKRDSDDDDDDATGVKNYLQMPPKVLLACLRIDSYYKPVAIPNINSLVKISKIEINLLNEVLNGTHTQLRERHETLKLFVDSMQIAGQHYNEDCEGYTIEAAIAMDAKDYGCDNLIPFIKKFNVKASLDFNHNDINLNLLSNQIQLKYSAAIGHSLFTTFQLWKQTLEKSIDQITFEYAKYIIHNNTASTICISQLETNEMIYILPQTSKRYQFYTDKLKQTLQISVAVQNDIWSDKTESFCINQEGIQHIKIQENQYFIVTVKNISNYQKRIVIDGQINVYNVTKERFTIQYKRYDKDINTPDKCEVQEFDLDSYCNGSLFGTCEYDSQQTIRIRMKRCEKKIFSGEIPLREIVVNNKPWLVKVPLASSNFICYWVRIIRQNVQNEVCRVLVLICPVFVSKSFFPQNIMLTEEGTNNHYEINGSGEITEIDMKGTHENEHKLIFPSEYIQQDKSTAVVTLSYKLINKNSFFKIPDQYSDVAKAIEKLDEKKSSVWPCSKDEEYQCIRNFTLNQTISTLYELSAYEPEGIICSTLLLTVMPWCIFINSTSYSIKITNVITNEACFINANDMTIPFNIESAFTLNVRIDGEWLHSDNIYINDETRRRASNSYELPLEGTTSVFMNHESDTLQFLISSTCVGKRRTIFIGTMLVVANHSKHDLGVIPFCVDINERIDAMKKNDFPVNRNVELHKNVRNEEKMGNPILCFSNLAKIKGKRKFGTNYTTFIIIRSTNDKEFSCPIKIQPTLRKCLNVSNGDKSISISVSILKHNEQYFVSIYNDSVPILNIKNNTDFNLYVAQTDMKNQATKYILPHKEIADERFTWYQVIASKHNIFYTPPVYNEHFPEILSHDYGLIFACVSGDDTTIRWSLPVKIDETKKIIINVPMFGDLKLLIDMKKITSEISINYIDSDELSSDSWEQFSENLSSNYQKSFSISKKRGQSKVLNVNVYLEGVNFIIYKDSSEKRIDLISLSVDDIITNYSKQSRKLKVNFSKLQVDNELFSSGNYDFPVLLCNKNYPIASNQDDLSPLSSNDIYEIIQRHQNIEKFSIEIDFYEHDKHIQNLTICILPIRVYVEDGFISVILELVEDCIPSNLLFKKHESTQKIPLSNGLVLIPNTIVEQAVQLSDPIRLNSFKLEAMHVLLSVHACRHFYIALDHSPLDFSIYEKTNIYTVPMKFGNNVGMHYISSAIFEAGWLLGGLEILGSPSTLTRSLTTGVKDFISMPIQGIFKGPLGFFIGLTHGSVSLFRNLTAGTLNSVTKMANSLARNLDHLTLDNDHIYLKTDALRRSRPQGFTDGLQLGLTGFGINILGAIGGLAHHPLQAKSAMDVVTGVGKGILGVFTKPISGIAELVGLMGTGMLQSVGYNVLPNPLNHYHGIENNLSVPNAEKIINKQLPQHANDAILLTCRATYVQKNDLKYVFLILIRKSLVIVDLEKDLVTDVIMLEKLSPIPHKAKTTPDNLFVFKLKTDETRDETSAVEKYHVSKRTVQYIQQLSSNHHSIERSSNEGDEYDYEESNGESIENKMSFYIDEVTGKYLLNYISFIKHQTSGETFFQPF